MIELHEPHRRSNAVVLIADRGYWPAALFAAHKLAREPDRTFDIILLAIGCSADERAVADTRIEVLDFELDARAKQTSAAKGRSVAVFGRLSLDEVLDDRYDKILYIDADVWIGDRSVSDLFHLDFQGRAVAAVRDAAEIVRGNAGDWLAYKRQLGLHANAGYFNSGMLLINRPAYRQRRIGEQCLDYLSSGKYRGNFNDQSALNAVLAGDWVELSPVWNWMYATRWELTRRVAPAIVHFIGPSKPWADRKSRHDPRFRADMKRVLEPLGYQEFVRDVPALPAARRSVARLGHRLARNLNLDSRDRKIREYVERFNHPLTVRSGVGEL